MLFQIILCMVPFTLAHLIRPPLNKNVIEDDLETFFDDDPSAGIVGGDVAPRGSHPWMAAVLVGLPPTEIFCGGSILSAKTVLTTAYCVLAPCDDNLFAVVVGTHFWRRGGQKHLVSSYMAHPQYNLSNYANDIGLLFLATDVVFSATVKPVVLNFQHVGDGTPLLVAGWGSVYAEGPLSPQLLQLSVTSLDTEECKRKMPKGATLSVNGTYHLCAYRAKDYGVCFGDIGSALTDETTHEQVGIVSWSVPCAIGYPEGFTRVSSYKSFLVENIK